MKAPFDKIQDSHVVAQEEDAAAHARNDPLRI